MSLIPENRPVIGSDLVTIKRQFGLSTADTCFLFGMSITKWTQLTRKAADKPVSDVTLAILVRFLSNHPELSVVPKMPSVDEMFDLLNSVAPIDQKRFSILWGAEGSAGYRWRKLNTRQGPALSRLMYCMRMALLSRSTSDRVLLLDQWTKTVEAEGRARGVPDVFKSGQWSPREVIEKSKQSIGAKAGAAKERRGRKKSDHSTASSLAE